MAVLREAEVAVVVVPVAAERGLRRASLSDAAAARGSMWR